MVIRHLKAILLLLLILLFIFPSLHQLALHSLLNLPTVSLQPIFLILLFLLWNSLWPVGYLTDSCHDLVKFLCLMQVLGVFQLVCEETVYSAAQKVFCAMLFNAFFRDEVLSSLSKTPLRVGFCCDHGLVDVFTELFLGFSLFFLYLLLYRFYLLCCWVLSSWTWRLRPEKPNSWWLVIFISVE